MIRLSLFIIVFSFSCILYGQDYTFRVLAHKGKNQIKKAGSDTYETLKTGAQLYENDEIIFGTDSYIALIHNSGESIEVRQTGKMKVQDLENKFFAKTVDRDEEMNQYNLTGILILSVIFLFGLIFAINKVRNHYNDKFIPGSESIIDKKVKSTFKENGYDVYINDSEVRISKKHSLILVLLYVVTILITIPFIVTGDYKLHLLFILLLGFPIIYRKWMLPEKVVFSNINQSVFINKNLKNNPIIPFGMIKNIEVDEKIISSDVSPFKEGYQDFIYIFKIKTSKDKEYKLFSLSFRRPMDELVKVIFDYFNSKISTSSQTIKY